MCSTATFTLNDEHGGLFSCTLSGMPPLEQPMGCGTWRWRIAYESTAEDWPTCGPSAARCSSGSCIESLLARIMCVRVLCVVKAACSKGSCKTWNAPAWRTQQDCHIQCQHSQQQVGSIPVVHGSALVQRGETQSLATATVTSMSDSAEGSSPLVVHFTAPPFASNDVSTCRHRRAPRTAAGCLMHKGCRRRQLNGGCAPRLLPWMPHCDPLPHGAAEPAAELQRLHEVPFFLRR